MPRLGRVCIEHSYIVDLDDEDMVIDAQVALHDDILSAHNYQELGEMIKVTPAPDADEGDIPEFLLRAICQECKDKVTPDDLDENGLCVMCRKD